MCPLNVDLLSVTFDPQAAEIHLLIVTHPLAAIKMQTIIVATCLIKDKYWQSNNTWRFLISKATDTELNSLT